MKFRYRITLLGVILAIGGCAVACRIGSNEPVALMPLPEDERDVVVEELGTSKYVDPSPKGGFCGTDVFSTYSGERVPHNVTAESALPVSLIEAVEELGWPIEEYEHRWFGEARIVLFSASPMDESKPLFVHAMEVVLIEDEDGSRIWSIPEHYLARPCG
ncbi:MAG: hypothetical protein OXD50_07725 [Chloroflexi bacterium]|nr:hypothetical protein [Chloroflexota bacterium]